MPIDLASLVKTAVSIGKQTVEGATTPVVYAFSLSEPSYDTTTGQITQSIKTYIIDAAVLTAFTRREIDTSKTGDVPILTTDQKLLIPYLDLPLTPGSADTVTINNETWNIVAYFPDPTRRALHTFQIRKP